MKPNGPASLCANIQAGEIVIFDKANVEFAHLACIKLSRCFLGNAAPRTMFSDRCSPGAPRPLPISIAAAGASKSFSCNSNKPSNLADFLGHSERAVKWQVWIALLAYVLLRFCAYLGRWPHSFTRLFALIRSALWQNCELRSLLEVYGTAGGGGRFLGTPQQAWPAGFG